MVFKKVMSRTGIHYLLRLVMFWLLYFTLSRLLLIVAYTFSGHSIGMLSATKSLFAGLRLDLSTCAYLMLFPFLLWGIHLLWKNKVIRWIHHGYHYILLFLFSALLVGNIKMYPMWETLINYSIFDYLAYPKEVASFVPVGELIFLILLFFGWFAFTIRLFTKIVSNFSDTKGHTWGKAAILLFTPAVIVLAARGGWQLIPINESAAYFSETPFYNHVAVNPVWYFIHSYLDADATKNPFLFMEPDVAEARNNNLFSTNEVRTDTILTSLKPNIVFILLESWTADIIKSLGGEENVTPYFDSLRQEGLLFTKIYSAGSRTEHSLVSVLSGYSPPARQSIITVPYKAEKLKSITDILALDGYHSSFYYGGDIGFANMKTFLLNAEFNTIVDKDDFEDSQLNSKWGAHDEYVLNKQLQDLKNTPEPFFSAILTLSSHEPFEVPMETQFSGNDEANKFRNATYYTDQCLRKYFEQAKKEKWYPNTLFVLVADHGQRLPHYRDLNTPESKHIPLLMTGGALKDSYRGKTIDKVANQNDITATVLKLLQKESADFLPSKDILHPDTKEFAYYTNDNVMGWVTPAQKFVYFYATGELKVMEGGEGETVMDSLLLDAKAYLQTHYQRYLEF